MGRPDDVPRDRPGRDHLTVLGRAQGNQIVFTPNGQVAYRVLGMSESGSSLYLRRVWDYAVCHLTPDTYHPHFQFTERTLNINSLRKLA